MEAANRKCVRGNLGNRPERPSSSSSDRELIPPRPAPGQAMHLTQIAALSAEP